MATSKALNILQLKKMKQAGLPISMITAYDYPSARLAEEVAETITKEISIPVIGIGAGRYCDGQVLVYHDMLQCSSPYREKNTKVKAGII